MKKRVFAVCLLVLLALVFWVLSQKKDSPNPDKHAPSSSNSPSNPQPSNPERQETPVNGRQSTADPSLLALRAIANLANRPIEFFGLVLDQDGKPVPGVKISLQVRLMKEPRPGAIGDLFEDIATLSDGNGLFSLADSKGSVLTVKALEKEGYEPSSKTTNRSYRYWDNENVRFKPDAARPEVFRMWKNAGAETLVRKGISSPLRYDGTASTFDLLDDEKASRGDIRVTLLRNPQQITFGQRNYEWTLALESLDGGLIESNDEQMYLAPADGYQPKLVIHMPPDASNWTDEKIFNVYLKLRGGKQYARAEIKALVGSDRATTPFYITSYVNPTGSRNLEYDSLQGVRKPLSGTKP